MKLFNTKRRGMVTTFLACLIMVLTLSACQKNDTNDAEMLHQAQKNAELVESLHFDMKIDMKTIADGEVMGNTMKITADIAQKPVIGRMTMDMGMLGTSEIYFKENSDKYDYYMGMDNGDGKIEWTKMQMDTADLQQYNVTDSADLLLKMQDYLKRAHTDKVNGKKAVCFKGVIAGDDMMNMVQDSGAMGNLGVVDINELKAAVYGKNITMPISVWVDQETSMPVKYSMDMTDIMGAVIETTMDAFNEGENTENAEDGSITVQKLIVTVEMSQFNEIGEIKIPTEVLKAQSVDDIA